MKLGKPADWIAKLDSPSILPTLARAFPVAAKSAVLPGIAHCAKPFYCYRVCSTMKYFSFHLLAAFVVTGIVACDLRAQQAQVGYLDVGFGYAGLKIDGSVTKNLDDESGFGTYIRGGLGPARGRGWNVGIGMDVSSWRYEGPVTSTQNQLITNSFQELNIIVPEVRIGYQQPLFNDFFFVEPSVGLGLAVGNYRTGNEVLGIADSATVDKWRAFPSIRPGLRFGIGNEVIAGGIETNYMLTHLKFADSVGGDVSTWFVGVFFQFRF